MTRPSAWSFLCNVNFSAMTRQLDFHNLWDKSKHSRDLLLCLKCAVCKIVDWSFPGKKYIQWVGGRPDLPIQGIGIWWLGKPQVSQLHDLGMNLNILHISPLRAIAHPWVSELSFHLKVAFHFDGTGYLVFLLDPAVWDPCFSFDNHSSTGKAGWGDRE